MFTLTRVTAALLLSLFMLWATSQFVLMLEHPDRAQGILPVIGVVSIFIGWRFLGESGKSLWVSAYFGVQAIVLAAVATSLLISVKMVFHDGSRMRFDGVTEALTAIPRYTLENLQPAIERDFLIQMGIGGVVIGVAVYAADLILTRRRLAR